jgi:hypothetical protein
MDHQEAAQLQLIERYLLEDLDSVQIDEFEAHLFACPQCSEDLRAAAILIGGARTSLRADADRPSGARAPGEMHHSGGGAPDFFEKLMGWIRIPAAVPVLAATALLAVVSYQNLIQIPGLRANLDQALAPRAVPAFALLPVTRGDEQIISVPPGSRSVVLSFDLTAPSADGYTCSFTDESNRQWLSLQERPASGADMLTLQLDPARIPAGRNLLTVRTRSGQDLMRFRFTFKP